ncbi:MAG: tetratricopeptide repeat protein [Acidimicrobiales bacterium]|nr:tetratricopeptide repeat protein [Acidimicrobiales bacterium]
MSASARPAATGRTGGGAQERRRGSARRARDLDPDELAALEEQRDFLLASIADLDREHAAGDLSDDDARELRDDYTARAAEVIRSIDARKAAFAEARPARSPARIAVVVVAVVGFAALAGWAAASALGARKAGESASGGITVSQTLSQQANECSTQITTDPVGAKECLEGVLEQDPTNAVALTWSAWQLSLVADQLDEPERTVAQAQAAVRLEEAVESDPGYSYARAFRAIVAYRNGRYADAQQYLEEFRANDPSAQAAQVIEQMDLEANIEAALTDSDAAETPSTTVPTED